MKLALINPQTKNQGMRELYDYHENHALGLLYAELVKINAKQAPTMIMGGEHASYLSTDIINKLDTQNLIHSHDDSTERYVSAMNSSLNAIAIEYEEYLR